MDYTGVLLMLKGTRKISERTVVKVCSRLGVDPPETDPHLGKQRQGLAPSVVAEPTAAYGKPTERESQLMAMIERLLATNEQLVNRLGTMERIVQALEKLDTRSERPEGEGRPGKSAAR